MAAGLPLLAKLQSRLEDVKKLILLILLGFVFDTKCTPEPE
jgi:hypothetical protein